MGEAVSLNYELDIDPESAWIMVTPDPTVKQAVPHVLELGDFRARKKYFTRRRNLPSYLIKLTLGGTGRLEYGGREALLPAGHMFWIDCMEPQHYRTAPGEEGWDMIWIHFYGPGCGKYYEWFLSANGGSNAMALPLESAVPTLLQKLIALYRRGDNTLADDIAASALVVGVMAECVAAAGRQPRGDAQLPPAVAGARAHLLRHFREPIALSELAAMHSLDRFYFQKLFKRHIGLSPKRFQALLRVNRAKELLQTSELSVGQIASQVGIESASRFIALFRAYEGMTPGKYREHWR